MKLAQRTSRVAPTSTPGGSSILVAQYTSAGVRQERCIHADAVDTPVGMLVGSTYYGHATDGLGSVNRLADASGNTAET